MNKTLFNKTKTKEEKKGADDDDTAASLQQKKLFILHLTIKNYLFKPLSTHYDHRFNTEMIFRCRFDLVKYAIISDFPVLFCRAFSTKNRSSVATRFFRCYATLSRNDHTTKKIGLNLNTLCVNGYLEAVHATLNLT